MLRDGFKNFQALYRVCPTIPKAHPWASFCRSSTAFTDPSSWSQNDPLLVENWDADAWKEYTPWGVQGY